MKTTLLGWVACCLLATTYVSGQRPVDARAKAWLTDPLLVLSGRPSQPRPAATRVGANGFAGVKAYNFITIDYPGAAYSVVLGSNGKTDVGVVQFDPSDPSQDIRPLVHTANKYSTFFVPGATQVALTDINNLGTMIGVYLDGSNQLSGFTYSAGVVTPFHISGSQGNQIRGINDAGDMVGEYYSDSGQHGFVDIGGVITTIDYPGGINTSFMDINNLGEAVGIYLDSGYYPHGFIWSNGVFTSLDYPGSLGTELRGINDAGKIVGDTFDATTSHGFVYQNNFSLMDLAGAKFTIPDHIDDKNNITGFYVDALNEYHGFKAH